MSGSTTPKTAVTSGKTIGLVLLVAAAVVLIAAVALSTVIGWLLLGGLVGFLLGTSVALTGSSGSYGDTSEQAQGCAIPLGIAFAIAGAVIAGKLAG